MSVPKAIFIDTSVYDAIKYDFESPTMKALIAEFEERKITLLCPAPINDEIKRHIREHSVSAINSLKSIGKENAFLRRLGNWPLNEKSHKELKEELENATNASYEAFRQNFESIDLGYDGVSVEEKEIEAILDAITLESHKIEAAINEVFAESDFTIEANWDGEVDNPHITQFGWTTHNFLSFEDGVATINFEAEIQYEAYVDYDDLESATYDGGIAYPHHRIQGTAEEETVISGTLRVKLKHNSPLS